MILFTYTSDHSDAESRWKEDGIGNEFFTNFEEERQVVLELRKDVAEDPEEDLRPIHIERIEILPVAGENVLTLLNQGIGPLVRNHEIIETID
ncbi:hypothetical protein [Phyllobacterium sp. K27]